MKTVKGVSALDHAKLCIDSFVKSWGRTEISDLEKYYIPMYEIWGAVHMAMYMLDFDDYNKLKKYIYDTYGYDCGGVRGTYDDD